MYTLVYLTVNYGPVSYTLR